MRKSGICPKCSNNQLLHVGAVADTGRSETEVRPMMLAAIFIGTGLLGGGENFARAGQLTAVVCRKCGYTEFYVLDPETITPDGRYVHEIGGAGPSDTPHR
jgi:predicted nucleic-acid-binding Zn-ribbon protein